VDGLLNVDLNLNVLGVIHSAECISNGAFTILAHAPDTDFKHHEVLPVQALALRSFCQQVDVPCGTSTASAGVMTGEYKRFHDIKYYK